MSQAEFLVTALRRYEDGQRVWYVARLWADSSSDAGVALGDKIRANDLSGVSVLGDHQLVPPGHQAGICDLRAQRLTEDSQP